MSTGLHLKPDVVEAASTLLAEMNAATSSLTYAALLTDDGFDVARFPVKTDGERFAGMASSMQALGDAVTHELNIGDSEYIIIASGKGHVVQLRVPGQELVLSALFDNDATVGHALAVTRSFAQKMADLLA
ncbi:roadblock/LC7 domain-containing protein [Pseudolysinimonas sp.]|uniref:roadblock/LC7 domain-containing protein n=1 Tax=Pseudolysinimonas sp. TaxID=2680009 RepID=UPI00286A09A0|nr:roadblock/LC7 domain-containing protein [Pseudolysinimonas sp.]